MRFLLLLLLSPLALSLAISPTPGIHVEITNKTTLTYTTDIVITLKVNNTQLSLTYGVDIYTIAVLNYQFKCAVSGNKSIVYVLQAPSATRTLSLADETRDLCLGEETYIAYLNTTFVLLSRDGRYVTSYNLDVAKAARERGVELRYTPEWRSLYFQVTTSYVDRCNWVQYDIKERYGGDIGIIKVLSHDCFNRSKAVRVAYQPYYHYMVKYIKAEVTLEIGNATIVKDISGGGEVIVPGPYGLYGPVTNLTIRLTGPQNSYAIDILNTTGPIVLVPPAVERRGLSGVIAEMRLEQPFLVYSILLNDTVAPEGLSIELQPPVPYAYAEVTKPNMLTLYLVPTQPQSVNFTLRYVGPGVVKEGNVRLTPIPAAPIQLSKQFPLAKATYYPITAAQPQPLVRINIANIKGSIAAYIEVEAAVTPRDALAPVVIYIATFTNKSGVLTPTSPRLYNSTNSGIYRGYPNKTLVLRWTTPLPPGDYQEVVVIIYGENVAKLDIKSGSVYLLTYTQTGAQMSPPPQYGVVAPIIATVAVAAVLIVAIKRL
ncbi:hypothetical protein Pogu_1428 [Pyrobaculum oguniense TE7]|uniref:Uncharacterized protein n=1 Tax=Pyrobaculum oguniense (strain DSM 13380 / JCM 10595 / TE7) TaxID=698757 RepID=H6QAH5_PYROT|nr:hypothetical protein Pogu_1428 [Pyrobaculum oguniense TE7]